MTDATRREIRSLITLLTNALASDSYGTLPQCEHLARCIESSASIIAESEINVHCQTHHLTHGYRRAFAGAFAK